MRSKSTISVGAIANIRYIKFNTLLLVYFCIFFLIVILNDDSTIFILFSLKENGFFFLNRVQISLSHVITSCNVSNNEIII